VFCYSCGKDNGEHLGLCAECEKHKAETPLVSQIPVQQFDFQSQFQFWIKPFTGILAVVVLLLLVTNKSLGTVDWEELVSNDAVSSCAYHKVCVISYVTPWCPACKSHMGQLKTFTKQHGNDSRFGFAVVVADRDREKALNFANQSGATVVYDDGQKIARNLGVRSFPNLVAVERGGKVLYRGNWVSSLDIESLL
jgi:thiol-disulfide isomerase/thioredoxin